MCFRRSNHQRSQGYICYSSFKSSSIISKKSTSTATSLRYLWESVSWFHFVDKPCHDDIWLIVPLSECDNQFLSGLTEEALDNQFGGSIVLRTQTLYNSMTGQRRQAGPLSNMCDCHLSVGMPMQVPTLRKNLSWREWSWTLQNLTYRGIQGKILTVYSVYIILYIYDRMMALEAYRNHYIVLLNSLA